MSTQTIHTTPRERQRISRPDVARALPNSSPPNALLFAWGEERLPSPLALLLPGYWLLARCARRAGIV